MPVVCVSHVCIVPQCAIRFIARSSALSTSACDIVCHAGSAVLCGIRISARSPFTTPSIYFCCARVCSPFRYRCEHCLLPHPAPFLSSIPSAACLNAVSQSISAPHLPHASSLARFCRKLSRIAGDLPEPPPPRAHVRVSPVYSRAIAEYHFGVLRHHSIALGLHCGAALPFRVVLGVWAHVL